MDFGNAMHRPRGLANRTGRSLLARLGTPVAATAYWLAVGLPVAYLAMLVTGIGSRTELGLFLGLLLVHLLALLGGRNYEPGTAGVRAG